MNSHMLGAWADGRWSPGFKASLQNKLNPYLFKKKKIIYVIYLNIKKCFIFYIFITFIYITYIGQKAGGIVQ